jgi:hypothetical protein
MNLSTPFSQAFRHTQRLLFRPFDVAAWFALGLIFFLDQLDGGGRFSTNFRWPGGARSSGTSFNLGETFREARAWVSAHIEDIVLFGSIALVALVLVSLLVMWLACRGHAMAVHAVARAEARVADAWSATRDAAWSLFRFRLVLAALALLAWGPLAVMSVMRALDLAERHAATSPMDYMSALAPFFILAAFLALAMAVVTTLLDGLVLPMMLLFRIPCLAAWRRLFAIARRAPLGIALYLVTRLGIGIAIAIVGTVAAFATCCLGALPVLHQTLLAPAYVFERAFSLFVLESFGPEYRMVTPELPPAPPPWTAPPPWNAPPPYS